MASTDCAMHQRATPYSSSDAFPISRVVFQSEYSGKSDHTLIILELQAKDMAGPVVPIITARPLKNFEFTDLTIVQVN